MIEFVLTLIGGALLIVVIVTSFAVATVLTVAVVMSFLPCDHAHVFPDRDEDNNLGLRCARCGRFEKSRIQ